MLLFHIKMSIIMLFSHITRLWQPLVFNVKVLFMETQQVAILTLFSLDFEE